MKRTWALLITGLLVLSLAACGTNPAPAADAVSQTPPASVEDSVPNASVPDLELQCDTVDVIYFKDLGDGAIMAACYTEEGTDLFGGDYFVIHVGDAELYNAEGQQVDLDGLTRGCELRVTWPGMVMESYPAQIAAVRVDALSDEPMDGVPPEDEIPPLFDGPVWWEETVTEVPNLMLDYRTDMYAVHCIIPPQSGWWSYSEEDSSFVGGADNEALSGLPVQDWTFDDNNTIKRTEFDTMTLSTLPSYSSITVTAYAYGDETDQGTVVELDDAGTMTLLSGNHIYVVRVAWADGQYQGSATYGFLVLDGETP